jgi:hypothetical protein
MKSDLTHTLVRRVIPMVLALLVATCISAITIPRVGAATAVAHTTTPNPTCFSTASQSGTSKVCVASWSTGITASYTDTEVSTQDINWISSSSSESGYEETNCVGPDFSVFIPLSAGEWMGQADLITGLPGSTPSFTYDLVVGGGNTTPPPPTSCIRPQPVTGKVDPPVVGVASTPDGRGYWLVSSDGAVQSHGDATWYGDLSGTALNKPIVGMTATPDGKGYWLVASDGGIFSFGDAQFYGSTGNIHLNKPIVGMAADAATGGYWLVASDGGIFSYNAPFYGSTGNITLNKPIVGMAADAATGGYWLVASDGGIFSYNAPFYGSTGNITLNQPIVGMEAAPDGSGYRFVASDGGVFCFNLPFEGSVPGSDHLFENDIAGMAASGSDGYWIVDQTNTLFAFGSAPYV